MVIDPKSTLTSAIIEQLHRLGHRIAQSGLLDLLAAYGCEEERQDTLRFDIAFLPRKLASAVNLLVLGDAIKLTEAEEILGADGIETLLALELAKHEFDSLHLPNLRLIRHFGVMLFCQQPAITARFYYGNDSLALGRLLLPVRGDVLDLCAGVGTQGLLCALTAQRVVSVEVQAEVAKLYAINSALNGLEEKMELRIGNLLEAVYDERFDRVCCNPPLLPVPHSLPYPPVGDGGEDGLTIIRRVVSHLSTLLTPTGSCQIIGTVVGNEAEAAFQELEDLAEDQELSIQLIVPWREQLEAQSPLVRSLALTISQYGNLPYEVALHELLASYQAMQVRYLYSFLLLAHRASARGEAGLVLTHHYLRGSSFWSV
ncbi:methyltransferase [Thermogemmatispora aurantia]|uniref:methyltransferase n=1 Tax=Thermogemmatispora aurantia TaxID=2045279 RepID=UPI00124DA159|nr:methyltransferase [Thermogemmatispora aurantia]